MKREDVWIDAFRFYLATFCFILYYREACQVAM